MLPTHGEDPFLGKVLAEKYRVVARLGSGGFGTVYSAVNVALGTEVAIKLGRGPEGSARMLREARAAASLRSPHSVRVYDVGELPGGAPFIVMELLPGRSLKQRLAKEGPLPLGVAAHFLGQVCAALREAHAAGLVHRDVKPSNLFVVEGPTLEAHVKLLDFGLVKSLEPSNDDPTKSGHVLGSPQYMSPEQVRGVEVTRRSDLWSLGVVLYECLSGKLPFERDTVSGTLVAIASEPMRPLAEVAPALPAAIGDIVARCLRKAPDERFESAEAVASALAPFATGPRWALEAPLALPAASEQPTDDVTWEPPSRAERGGAGRVRAAVVLAVVAVAVLFVSWRERGASVPPSNSGVPPKTTGAPPPAPRDSVERPPDVLPELPSAAPAPRSSPKRAPAASASRPPQVPVPTSRLAVEPNF